MDADWILRLKKDSVGNGHTLIPIAVDWTPSFGLFTGASFESRVLIPEQLLIVTLAVAVFEQPKALVKV